MRTILALCFLISAAFPAFSAFAVNGGEADEFFYEGHPKFYKVLEDDRDGRFSYFPGLGESELMTTLSKPNE